MFRYLLIALFFAWPLLGQTNIPIQNPSFEQDTAFTADACGPWSTMIPSWTVTKLQSGGGAGVFQPTNPSPCNVSLPPDGTRVAYLFQASMSQDLGYISGDGFFTLLFSVANRFYWYPAAYFADLKVVGPNGTLECSISGQANGDFIQVPLVCPTQRRPGDMVITFVANGVFQAMFDKVSLTFTPTS